MQQDSRQSNRIKCLNSAAAPRRPPSVKAADKETLSDDLSEERSSAAASPRALASQPRASLLPIVVYRTVTPCSAPNRATSAWNGSGQRDPVLPRRQAGVRVSFREKRGQRGEPRRAIRPLPLKGHGSE